MENLFLNGSPNANGSTADLARQLFAGRDYDQVNLGDRKIFGYGTPFAEGDDFETTLDELRAADVIVIGSPCYWHDLSGILRNFLDRCYGPLEMGGLAGKKVALLFQGSAPTQQMYDRVDYTVSRFAALYGAEYVGMATTPAEARELGGRL